MHFADALVVALLLCTYVGGVPSSQHCHEFGKDGTGMIGSPDIRHRRQAFRCFFFHFLFFFGGEASVAAGRYPASLRT